MDELKIRFVVATRESRDGFFKSTAAGKFLQLYDFPFIELDLSRDLDPLSISAQCLPLHFLMPQLFVILNNLYQYSNLKTV